MSERVDLAVIGGGPTGLYAVYSAGLHGLRAALFEAMPRLGGQLANLYPDKPIYDVGGFPEILAQELVERLVEQASRYRPEIYVGEPVRDLQQLADRSWRIVSPNRKCMAGAVLVATGIGAFRPRLPSVPGIERWMEGDPPLVRTRLQDLEEMKGREVLVAGGGDSAVDAALTLVRSGAHVTLVHRRLAFRAAPANVEELEGSGARFLLQAELAAIEPAAGGKAEVLIRSQNGGDVRLTVDAVHLALGYHVDARQLINWGMPVMDGKIQVDWQMETGREGLYAAGDAVLYPGKVPLIASGFAEAAAAVLAARRYLHPDAPTPAHSSHRGAVGTL